MGNFDDYKLGISDELIQLQSREENREMAACMAAQSRRSIDIISRLLDPSIFDTSEFIEAIKRLVTKARKPKVRIIVFDPDTIVKNGHRITDLAGHLSSFIEIRKAAEQHKHYSEALMVTDGVAFLHCLNWDRYEATANFNDRRQSRYYLKEFDSMWDVATPDPNLRRMSL